MRWEIVKCPDCGEELTGTLEEVQGEALLQPDGKGGYDYQGQTNIFWDYQQTVRADGKDTLLCDNGHSWLSARIKENGGEA